MNNNKVGTFANASPSNSHGADKRYTHPLQASIPFEKRSQVSCYLSLKRVRHQEGRRDPAKRVHNMRRNPAHDALYGVAHELGRCDDQTARHQHHRGEERVQAENRAIRRDVLPFQVVLQAPQELVHLRSRLLATKLCLLSLQQLSVHLSHSGKSHSREENTPGKRFPLGLRPSPPHTHEFRRFSTAFGFSSESYDRISLWNSLPRSAAPLVGGSPTTRSLPPSSVVATFTTSARIGRLENAPRVGVLRTKSAPG